jgi:hypothetical protein
MGVRLFLGNLPYEANSQTVAGFLWQWVSPESALIVADRDTGRSKGFGRATVWNPEEAVIACRADGSILDGRSVTIAVEVPSRSRPRVPLDLGVEDGLRVANDAASLVLTVAELQQELLGALTKAESGDIWTREALARLDTDDDHAHTGSTRRRMEHLVHLLAQHPQRLPELHPRVFEHLIAALLSASGYRDIRLSVPSADGGVDIYATRNTGFGRSLYLVQCKRYSPNRRVTRPEVQLTYGVLAANAATQAAIITTSSFTKPAQDFLREQQHDIGGLDLSGLKVWLQATSQMLQPNA